MIILGLRRINQKKICLINASLSKRGSQNLVINKDEDRTEMHLLHEGERKHQSIRKTTPMLTSESPNEEKEEIETPSSPWMGRDRVDQGYNGKTRRGARKGEPKQRHHLGRKRRPPAVRCPVESDKRTKKRGRQMMNFSPRNIGKKSQRCHKNQATGMKDHEHSPKKEQTIPIPQSMKLIHGKYSIKLGKKGPPKVQDAKKENRNRGWGGGGGGWGGNDVTERNPYRTIAS